MTKNISRRRFIKKILFGLTYFNLLNLFLIKRLNAKSKPKVVILGTGIGGASCLQYLNKMSDLIDITVIDKNNKIRTGPLSNLVIGDILKEDEITFSLNKSRYKNVIFVNKEVKYIDSDKKLISLTNDLKISFDFLIISPGISYKNNIINTSNASDQSYVPHCWDGDSDISMFKKKLYDLENNSKIIITSPDYPYRCPPAPYERASLIANYFKRKKMNVKILVLDSKNSFTKQQNFFREWNLKFRNTIEWVSRKNGGKVVIYDHKNNLVKNDQGQTFKANFINVIPDQKAGKVIFDSRLLSDKKDWCSINPVTFELKNFKDIYVVGDSVYAWDMPKSGFSANSQAKVLTMNLINRILEKKYIDPLFLNTCYSFSDHERAFSISAWYRLNKSKNKIISTGSNESFVQSSKSDRRKEAEHAYGWYKTLVNDIFL